ncbi:MAG: acetamidase/formamidase family protein [Eubacteriales bacterium]|nr:acetamidase/formamidase family protein [Eubacteriales bacterium]MDD4583664.1 acetamidase/formamidase family protein [Eubacteriales bacterium]
MYLSKDNVIFNFNKDHTPVLRVTTPATLDVETFDCFSNQLRDPSDRMDQLDWERINPATGPIFVEGAEPGDTLKVSINRINLNEKGTICCMENEGTLGHMIKGTHIRIAPIENGIVKYLNFEIPVKKMIGVIGVAPMEGAINTGTPGHHGGNMDTLMITEGATIYFHVAVPGALFALGDCHAVMGDGEIGVSALECPATINLTLDIIKGKGPEYPVLENKDEFAIIVSKPTVDEAIFRATELMCEFLEQRLTTYSRPEIIMLMSLVGNVQISQVVDPEKTVRFVFPKKYAPGAKF